MDINTVTAVKESTSDDLAGMAFDCPLCQRIHTIPIQMIKHGAGLRAQLPERLTQMTQKARPAVAVIYDRKIHELVAEKVLPEIRRGCAVNVYGLGGPGIWLDSAVDALEQVLGQITEIPDAIVGVGSGVISDSTKWLATRLGKPFAICGTALSMNGYTSITATISEHGVKKSMLLNPPELVMVDTDLAVTAPLIMTQAGLGDLAARSICNADWRLSNLLRGTYFCELPFTMLSNDYQDCLKAASELHRDDSQASGVLAEGLLKSGLTMTILGGESSPSSGCEHILSHYWDWQAHVLGLPHNLHGYQVGIGTLIAQALYEVVLSLPVGRMDAEQLASTRLSIEAIHTSIDQKYGVNGLEFKQVAEKKYLPDDEFRRYIQRVVNDWDYLAAEVARFITPASEITTAFEQIKMEPSLSAISRSRQDAVEALLFGSRYRARYTMLDLAWDLGIFPEVVDEVITRAGV